MSLVRLTVGSHLGPSSSYHSPDKRAILSRMPLLVNMRLKIKSEILTSTEHMLLNSHQTRQSLGMTCLSANMV
jgi:hypothetical protein